MKTSKAKVSIKYKKNIGKFINDKINKYKGESKESLIIIKRIKANLQFVMDFELVFFVHNEKAMMCYSKDWIKII